uniref:Uncharacterized protein n=1 Tax=Anopheles arabiensis TaxID=7173 RepID=A0A182IFS4_ANOAR
MRAANPRHSAVRSDCDIFPGDDDGGSLSYDDKQGLNQNCAKTKLTCLF